MIRILVADDDSQTCTLLRAMLAPYGYEVEDASNGNEALAAVHTDPPGLVIMDLVMPEKEGIETIMEIRRDFPDMPIIAISGAGRIDSQCYLEMAKMLGATRTLAKPFRRDELLDAVQGALGCMTQV